VRGIAAGIFRYAPTPPSTSEKSGKRRTLLFHFDKMGGLTELRKIVKK
jgi:hypothetical protein